MQEEQRRLLETVSRASFANPFGEERSALDAELAGTSPEDPAAVDRAAARVATLREAIGSMRRYEGEEATLVGHLLLFDAFHRFAPSFDALVEAQAGGQAPLPFPEHEPLGAFLVAGGWPEARVGRVLELFYQLRRGFLFLRDALVGQSRPMRGLREALWNQLFTRDVRRYEEHLWNRMEDFSVLLLGETGTGKGAAAAALGRSGFLGWEASAGRFETSFEGRLVPLNLAEVPGSLLESALFGHEKGAFTGAVRRTPGALARCPEHGALFLDEIGEVPPAVQVKLLRVLQERSFTPLGAERAERFPGRVLAATHRPLAELRAEGGFRDDFYYRLCSSVVELPPLRARLADDAGELDLLLATLTERIAGSDALAPVVREAIARDLPPDYRWPGNVRELEQVVRRVMISGRCTGAPLAHAETSQPADGLGPERSARELLDAYCASLYARHGTYEAVARITQLDRRTVKKHVLAHEDG
ncbi:MAG: sigma 54-interacting transcriptional regulator [Myxococcota bacterium]